MEAYTRRKEAKEKRREEVRKHLAAETLLGMAMHHCQQESPTVESQSEPQVITEDIADPHPPNTIASDTTMDT